MMKNTLLIVAAVALVASPVIAEDLEQRASYSRAVVSKMVTAMKGEMQSAMKEGGPVHAIEVCSVKAPKMAAKMSEKQGWIISRTSLKARNAGNEPDAWEKNVLMDFEKRKQAGEDVKTMEHYEVVDADGKKQFRYMKAIPTAEVCLKCHAAEIDPKVEARIKDLYPTDKARGFEVGDIRGAFTIKQPM